MNPQAQNGVTRTLVIPAAVALLVASGLFVLGRLFGSLHWGGQGHHEAK